MLPAYAGMIPNAILHLAVSAGAPRICGDDPNLLLTVKICEECSPHMRG